jgi:hypothetical protein
LLTKGSAEFCLASCLLLSVPLADGFGREGAAILDAKFHRDGSFFTDNSQAANAGLEEYTQQNSA